MTGSTLALAFAALMFAVMGVGSILAPTKVTAQFGIPNLDREGRNEVRAVYGGFGLAMAGVLLAAIVVPEWREGIALTVGLALGGMAAGRALSAMMDRGLSRTPAFYMGLELIGLAILLWVAL